MKSAIDVAKSLTTEHNVAFNVYDEITGQLLQHHEGHNAATNSMLTGIAHYLMGDGVLNQGYEMLEHWVPQYISLGTMGLYSQEADDNGLPLGIGYSSSATEEQNFVRYADQCPGFGADGYDANENNGREFFGLGNMFDNKSKEGYEFESYIAPSEGYNVFLTTYVISSIVRVTVDGVDKTDEASIDSSTYKAIILENIPITSSVKITYIADYTAINCELISSAFPRVPISYRQLIQEDRAELPRTIDVVMSAMVSTGALKQFREADSRYLFITEAGLWSKKYWPTDENGNINYLSGDNGLLAGYRIMPANGEQQDMTVAENREALKHEILRVGFNQVVQVVWKLQLGSIREFSDSYDEAVIRRANTILENAIEGTPT